MTSTISAPTNPPSGPRPPDSRMRWHILAAVAGTILAAAALWASTFMDEAEIGPQILGALGTAALMTVWALLASHSSLGYLVPGIALGVLALVQHFVVDIPLLGDLLLTPTNGVIVAICIGLAVSVHVARRDGRSIVTKDEIAAAVHASHAPESRIRRHVITGIGAVILATAAFVTPEFWHRPMVEAPAGTTYFPWGFALSLVLFVATAKLGGFSSLALVVASGVGVVFLVFGQAIPSTEPVTVAIVAILLLSASLTCRLARRAGVRFERRERAVSAG